VAKTAALGIVTLVHCCAGWLLGFLSSLAFHGTESLSFSFPLGVVQLFHVWLVSFCLALITMVICDIVKGYLGIAIVYAYIFFGEFLLQGVSSVFYAFVPYAYISSHAEDIFSNVAHLESFEMENVYWIAYWPGLLVLLAWIPLLVGGQALIRRRRQF
jgi:hypothetical protein